MKYGCLGILWAACFNIFLNAQSAPETTVESYASECISRLHKGDLIVQLRSEQKKLQALASELDKGGTRYREKVLREIARTEKKRDSFNFHFIREMGRSYRFSRVYFFYDSDRSALKQNGYGGKYFIDSLLKKSLERRTGGDYFLLQPGITKTQSLDAWIVSEPAGSPLPAPFPAYYRMNNFRTWRHAIFHPSDAERRDAVYFARTLQKRLEKFFRAMNYEL